MKIDLTQEERYYIGEWLSERIKLDIEIEESKFIRKLFDKLKLSCFIGEK
jgi:hypothetical protein